MLSIFILFLCLYIFSCEKSISTMKDFVLGFSCSKNVWIKPNDCNLLHRDGNALLVLQLDLEKP